MDFISNDELSRIAIIHCAHDVEYFTGKRCQSAADGDSVAAAKYAALVAQSSVSAFLLSATLS